MSTTITGNDVYGASLTIPSDGDKRNAASVNVALQALADRTTWLKNRTAGASRLISVAQFGTAGATNATFWTAPNWPATAIFLVGGAVTLATIGGTVVGDVIEAVFTTTMSFGSILAASYVADVRLEYFENAFSPGAMGALQTFQPVASAATGYTMSTSMATTRAVANAGTFSVCVNGCVPTGTANNWNGIHAWSLIVKQWRAN